MPVVIMPLPPYFCRLFPIEIPQNLFYDKKKASGYQIISLVVFNIGFTVICAQFIYFKLSVLATLY